MRPFLPEEPDDISEATPGAAPDNAELARLRGTLEGQLAMRGLADVYREALQGDLARFGSQAKRDSLHALRTRIAHGVRPTLGGWQGTQRRRTSRLRLWASLAAAIVVASGLSWFAAREYFMGHETGIAIAPAREVSTRRGERATLDLTDGTRVILAPQSLLRIPATYATTTGLGARDVELDGEAYFEVTHDTARPFRVRTTVGIAEDLGTEFVVTTYPEAHGMRVLVATGAVAIHAPSVAHDTRTATPGTGPARPLAVLRPGDLAHLDSAGILNLRQDMPARELMAWTTGRLVFADTPLPDVLAMLQRWYDVEFRLADSALAHRRVTAAFKRTSLQNVVADLALVLDVRAERHGRVVTLSARSGRTMTDSTTVTPQGGTGIR